MKATQVTIEALITTLIQNALTNSRRDIVGIVGGPAAGKSTLAAALCNTINEKLQASVCIVVPMDGFHYPNAILRERHLAPMKGKPQTFDANGFVKLLWLLRDRPEATTMLPAYSRALHEPVPNAIEVNSSHKIVLLEGNYLLLDIPPWCDVNPLLNHSYYLSTPLHITLHRLIKRHRNGGSSLVTAMRKVLITDLSNYFLIEKTRPRANQIIAISDT